ncbi:MAG: CbiM family transporter [Gemmataceae bacterium]|nr:CbiM family transporter [Gemmataceae bacterium]MCS7269711.1 CbiM family transporter [Gemmataceae bacterium]MDW8242314.1 CbiM family transporter [Thermogemmata sp.]
MSYTLWSVHLADGVLAAPWLLAGWLGAASLLAVALWKLREEEIPRIGLLSAAFFVSSSLHIRLPVVPTSVHLLLNGLVGVLLGRRAPAAIAVGLALQYLLLAHGGLTTLGLNTCIMSLPALAAAWGEQSLRHRLPAPLRGALVGGGCVAGTAVLNFLALLWGGKEEWGMLASLVLLAHLPVAGVEAIILGVLLAYLERVKPELLASMPWGNNSTAPVHAGNSGLTRESQAEMPIPIPSSPAGKEQNDHTEG